MTGPYQAVTKKELVARLGMQCSPDRNRDGYVIGPDITGRICHCASCSTMTEARANAAKQNERWRKEQDQC